MLLHGLYTQSLFHQENNPLAQVYYSWFTEQEFESPVVQISSSWYQAGILSPKVMFLTTTLCQLARRSEKNTLGQEISSQPSRSNWLIFSCHFEKPWQPRHHVRHEGCRRKNTIERQVAKRINLVPPSLSAWDAVTLRHCAAESMLREFWRPHLS